jgi:UDP-glucose 4-epimerase
MKKVFEGLKVLITGGAGFVGSHLSEYLVSCGARVCILDDLSTGKMENIETIKEKCKVIIDDIRKKSAFEEIGKVDIIFHEAARPLIPSFEDPVLDLQVNTAGTINVLEFARKFDSIVVHASTGSVYGNPVTLPISEQHPLNPVSPYGVSKLAAEEYCKFYVREYGLNVVCLRYFNVYGPRQAISQEMGVIPIFVSRVLAGKPLVIFGDGRQTRDFTHVSDVVKANILAAIEKNAKGKIVNIGSGKETSILDLASLIMTFCRRKMEPTFSRPKQGDIRRLVADISFAKEILRYEPSVELKRGVADYIEWYKHRRSM